MKPILIAAYWFLLADAVIAVGYIALVDLRRKRSARRRQERTS